MLNIKVIYEDECLMVIDKPAGLVVTPTLTQHEITLAEILQKDYGVKLERGGIVHRLDKDTSGLMVVAKTQAALENLQSQFKGREVKKEYLALVHGEVAEKGTINASIARNPRSREKFIVTPDGREAVTEYEPVENFQFSIFNNLNKIQIKRLERMNYNQFSLVRCFPRTGRTHQIRVHLKYINHPLVADEKYGGRKLARLDKKWCPRQFLHAARLEFTHPVSGKKMVFGSQLPEDLMQALQCTS